MRIAVCDDDSRFRENLVDMVNKLKQPEDTVSAFADGEQLLRFMHRDYPFDLTILDIEMPFYDGASAAGKIREAAPDAIIIIVTNHSEYAIEFYKYRAFDYLLKPVSAATLKRILDRARGEMVRQGSVLISNRQGCLRLPVRCIYYFEVRDRAASVFSSEGVFTYTKSMNELLHELSTYDFYQVNRAQLVNLDHVQHVRGNRIILSGGGELNLATRRTASFKQAWTRFISNLNKGPGE